MDWPVHPRLFGVGRVEAFEDVEIKDFDSKDLR